MAIKRSSEEFAMREAIAAWGRKRWPGARLVHELVVAQECRVDMAFIGTDSITGIEIKSSRDTLDRLENQVRVFRAHLPSVIVAVAPKWMTDGYFNHGFRLDGWVCCTETQVIATGVIGEPRRQVTAPMLDLLWASELRAIAARTRVSTDPRRPGYRIIPDLARMLTGDEIVREVCRELRARDAFPKTAGHPASDPPISFDMIRANIDAPPKEGVG